jgi:hypothetical protein
VAPSKVIVLITLSVQKGAVAMQHMKTVLLAFGLLSMTIHSVQAASNDAVYQIECGACHVPYPTNFLSEKS